MSVSYDGVMVGEYAADLLVEGVVRVELRAVKALDEVHMPQWWTVRIPVDSPEWATPYCHSEPLSSCFETDVAHDQGAGRIESGPGAPSTPTERKENSEATSPSRPETTSLSTSPDTVRGRLHLPSKKFAASLTAYKRMVQTELHRLLLGVLRIRADRLELLAAKISCETHP
ncbi:MAG: hypothetical protein HY713_08675 [candidate division NC10 bacterium]|nr:hypothetical protein [candidate division NC10 bacterium]